MELQTAKEILKLNVKEAGKKMPADTLDALKLHIECASTIQFLRLNPDARVPTVLYGETPEGESP